MGLSLRNIGLSVWDRRKKKEIYSDFGELLFTHFGLSGPVILSASSHLREMEPGAMRRASISSRPCRRSSLTPACSAIFLRIRTATLSTRWGAASRKLIPVAVRRSGIPGDLKCNAITREMRRGFLQLLKSFSVEIQGFRSLAEAIVTSGGVSVKELNPKTMESGLVSGLYFAGEVVDVDAYTGGFNLQIAFSTGRAAAEAIASKRGEKGGILQ